ncbi:GTP-binding protein Era-like-protein [Desulfovibrio sp. X2]|uniref:GTPase Era n=1 Tax=Desulfovibrio sp. X2 TaxID=941449 RepID=UPI000358E3CF|nr:GTPase Era [Desulfovibrio sp. X2]EPR44034.1 GTP-binding protein Era-like-protein [Desulfovibrio sp. X2]
MTPTTHTFGTVALMGPPNAGKSTLLNRILGEKLAIVTPKPQTTRNRISGIWTTEDAQVVFLDTPGVHRLRGRMNKFLLQAAWDALAQADAVAAVLDAALYAKKPGVYDKDVAPLADALRGAGRPLLVLANKIDQVADKRELLRVLAAIAETWPEAEIIPVSAATGDGVDVFLKRLVELLPEGDALFPDDQLSTVPLRFMVSEIVREKVFMELEQELPYQTAVEIESWEEEGALLRVGALIWTARENHKGIIIGRRGERLKRVGQAARLEIEELTGMKVHLQLWVKVREGWTEDPGFLRGLGFGE